MSIGVTLVSWARHRRVKKEPRTRKVDPDLVSEQLRAALNASRLSSYRISQVSGVDPGVIQRFRGRERSIRIGTLDRLARALGLRLVRVDS
jgi:hypothetical protein